jgi:signal transduction histidine kinase
MLAEKLRDSRAANVARAVDLLDASPMERAKVMTYLKGAAAELVGERGALQGEVETLARSVEHIKEIVAVQQGYARAPGGTEETLAASAVLAEALRMLGDSSVEIVRDLADDPSVTVEKHKVVQILINLLRNARQACEGGSAPRVTVRVERAVPGRLRFTVRDNGVGIAPETLARVFEHGFTTRKDGHGFGLHGAALMARELGGSLEAASEGPGRGATFVLDLPLVAATRTRTPRPLESAG